jgi:hypothetical protein
MLTGAAGLDAYLSHPGRPGALPED